VKEFRVVIVQTVLLSFEDDRATEKSAEHVAARCWGSRALVGDSGSSRNLGNWTARLANADVTRVTQEGGEEW
jgi:hypothetical protein